MMTKKDCTFYEKVMISVLADNHNPSNNPLFVPNEILNIRISLGSYFDLETSSFPDWCLSDIDNVSLSFSYIIFLHSVLCHILLLVAAYLNRRISSGLLVLGLFYPWVLENQAFGTSPLYEIVLHHWHPLVNNYLSEDDE